MGAQPHTSHPELFGPTWSLPGATGWTLLELSAPFEQVETDKLRCAAHSGCPLQQGDPGLTNILTLLLLPRAR